MKKLLLLIPLLALLFVVASTVKAIELSLLAENTLALCGDNQDNDGDMLVDLSDSDCSPFIPAPVLVENTLALCTDNQDNDGDILVDFSDSDCAAFIPAPVLVENTLALCSDNIDNDGDILVDLSDSDCTAFVPAPAVAENTLALCTDNQDNDGDILVDFSDSDCAPFIPVATTTPAPTTTSGSGFSGSTGFGGGSGFSSGGLTTGTPISGIATSSTDGIDLNCARLFKTYMHIGRKNNVAEVTRLQAFLNKNLGTKISPTGLFGSATLSAVKLFQLKYSDSVLKPWVDAGLSTDLTTNPSGYVYLTTQRQINLLECPIAEIPMPVLK